VLIPLLDRLVETHGTVPSERFAADYLDAVQPVLGARLVRPKLVLRILAAGFDKSMDDARGESLHRALHDGPYYSMWSETADCCGALFMSQMRDQPNIAHLTVVASAHVPLADFIPPKIRDDLELHLKQAPAAFAVWDEQGLPRIVIAARDKAALEAAYRALAATDVLSEGVFDVSR
jgi:hypothetical protein